MRTDRQGEAIQTRARALSPKRLDDPDPTAGDGSVVLQIKILVREHQPQIPYKMLVLNMVSKPL